MLALYVLNFALAAGNGAVFALLPEIQEARHLPTWSLGLVAASAFAAALVSQLVLSRYADRGRTRPLLLTGMVLGTAGFLLTGVGRSLLEVAGGRAMAGLGVGMVLPAARRLLVLRRPDAAGEVLGRFLAVDVTGFVLGAPIAAALAELSSVAVAFAVLAGAVAVCGPSVSRLKATPTGTGRDGAVTRAVATVGLPKPSGARPAPEAMALPSETTAGIEDRAVLRRLLRRRPLRAGLALGTATFWAIGVFDTIWAKFLTDLGRSSLVIGITLACFGLPMAAVAGRGGRLADRWGPLRSGLVGVVATAPAMALYGQTGALGVLVAVAIVHSLLDGINMPATQAAVVSQCGPDELAAGQGLLSATQMSTAAVAALIIAPLYGAFGATVTFAVAGGGIALAWSVALWQAGAAAFAVGATRRVEPVSARP